MHSSKRKRCELSYFGAAFARSAIFGRTRRKKERLDVLVNPSLLVEKEKSFFFENFKTRVLFLVFKSFQHGNRITYKQVSKSSRWPVFHIFIHSENLARALRKSEKRVVRLIRVLAARRRRATPKGSKRRTKETRVFPPFISRAPAPRSPPAPRASSSS